MRITASDGRLRLPEKDIQQLQAKMMIGRGCCLTLSARDQTPLGIVPSLKHNAPSQAKRNRRGAVQASHDDGKTDELASSVIERWQPVAVVSIKICCITSSRAVYVRSQEHLLR